MNEADILALTYFDTFTVKRKVKIKDPITGVTKHELKVVSENNKGAVNKKDSQLMATDGIGKLVYTHELYAKPNVGILEGDILEVTSCGKITNYLASKPFHYETHIVLPITFEGRI